MRQDIKPGDFVQADDGRVLRYVDETEDGKHLLFDPATGASIKVRTMPDTPAEAPTGLPAYDELISRIRELEAERDSLLAELEILKAERSEKRARKAGN